MKRFLVYFLPQGKRNSRQAIATAEDKKQASDLVLKHYHLGYGIREVVILGVYEIESDVVFI